MRSESSHFKTLFCLLLFPCISIYSQTKTLTLSAPDAGIRTYQTRDAIYFDPDYRYTATTSTSMHASTDPTISCNTNYIPFNELQDPINRPLDQNLAVGATSGEFNVSATGGATYQIPIYTPSGTGGFQPQISLSYNSQGGNGLLGIGWNLSGISAITRVPQNYYNDTNTTAVSLNVNDKFALDGNRLIEDGTHFHTENETFSTITPNGTSGTGPSWFKVETREGKTFEYGNSSNSYLQAQNQDEIIFWYLNKVTDNYGNKITYTYHNDRNTGQIWLESIDYTDNSTPINSIKFYYENRQDKSVAYINGNSINNQKILNKILVTTGNSVARKYQFNYTLANNVSQLVEIIEENGEGKRYNSTLITWSIPETPIIQTIVSDNNLFNYIFNVSPLPTPSL